MSQERGAGRTANQAKGGSAKRLSPLTDLPVEEIAGFGVGIPIPIGPILKWVDKGGRKLEENIKKLFKK